MGLRKNYRNLTAGERNRFVEALHHVKTIGVVDQFANDHLTFFHRAHHSSHFLPWHREFLLRFEAALRTHHPDVTIPYWNSTVDTSPSDPLWANNFLGQFDSAWGLGRTLGASGTLPTPQEVHTTLRLGTYDAFWPDLESVIHDRPHIWVGGVMATGVSPGDPVFYLHHAWIDLLWAQWQLAHHGAPFVASGPGFGLNDPMPPWNTAADTRTPADVLDHHAVGYSYDIEYPIVHFVTTQNISATFPCTTYVNHPLTNGNPNAILFVTHSWNPLGMPSGQGQFNNHPIGVWYDDGPQQQWAIYNEDGAAMVEGVAFNVSVYANLLGP